MADRDFNRATGMTAAEDAKRRATRMMKEKQFFETKAGEFQGKIHSQQTHDRLDLDRTHDLQRTQLQDKLDQTYGEHKQRDRKELKALAKKSKLSKRDRERGQALQKNLANIRQREKEQHDALKTKQTQQAQTLDDKHKAQSERAERAVSSARQDRQASGWKPAPVVFDASAANDSVLSFQKPAQGVVSTQGEVKTSEGTSSAPRPYLAPKGARTGNLKPESSKGSSQALSGTTASKGMGL